MKLYLSDLNVTSIALRMILAVVMGAIIGCERATKRHSAGLRTFILVSLSSAIAMMLDLYLGVIAGMGMPLLSAATILATATISVHSLFVSSRSQIKGLTTAVALWASGIIGLTVGAGLYTAAILAFLTLVCSLSLFPWFEKYLKDRSNHFEVHLELKSSSYLQDFVATIRLLGLTIDDIESNPAYFNSGLSVYSISVSIASPELKKYKTHTEIIQALRSLDYVFHIEEIN
jgi:putative Mg2+ transporter-C (MgtC) family protein